MNPCLRTGRLLPLVAAMPLLGAIVPDSASASQPNILFIFSDDHRHELLGKVNPTIQTPSLDALADSGIRFDHAFATTAICSPARAAVLSGRYGTRNGVPTLSDPLTHPDATFVHDLAKAGYHTAQAGKWHLGTTPSAAGFQDYARINSNGSWFNRSINTNIPGVATSLGGTFYETFMADVVIDWIEDHTTNQPDKPFFMWWCNQVPHVDGSLSYPDVKTDPSNKVEHTPWGTAGGYRANYNVANMVVPANWSDDLSTKPPYLATSRFVTKSVTENYGGPGGYTNPNPGVRNATLGEDNVQQHQLEYDAAITALDAEIGRVLARLEDPNGDGDTADSIADNTWIVFMGDNGWQTGHHKFTSKVLAYEEACRVPLLVKGPGVTPRVESKIALNIDVTPMFYDIAGLPVPAHLQGKDLRDLVANPATAWRDRFYYEAVVDEPSLDAEPHDAIRTEQYKLIRTYASRADAAANTNVTFEELYDLNADPGELTNLANDPGHAAVKAELVTALETEKAAVAATPDPVAFTTPDFPSNPGFEATPFDSGWSNSGVASLSAGGLGSDSVQSALLGGTGSIDQGLPGLSDGTIQFAVQPVSAAGDQTFRLELSRGGSGATTPFATEASADTYLREAATNNLDDKNWGNDTTDGGEILLGGNNGGDMRPLLRFDLSGVSAPPGQTLVSASLEMTVARSSNATGTLRTQVHEYAYDFVEGTGNGSEGTGNGATWNDPDGDDVDVPGGADPTAGGSLGTTVSTLDVPASGTLVFPSSQDFIDAVNGALGGNLSLLLDPLRSDPATTWPAEGFIGIASREKGVDAPVLRLTFAETTPIEPVIRLRGTAAGGLEVDNGGSWVPVAGSAGALSTGQTSTLAVDLHDLAFPPAGYDLRWSDPGSETLGHSASGLGSFANGPDAAGIERIAFARDSGGDGTALVDSIEIATTPSRGLLNGNFERLPNLVHWWSASAESAPSFTDSSPSNAARLNYNVPSQLYQEVRPASDFTLSTLFQLSGVSNDSLELRLHTDSFAADDPGIVALRATAGGILQANAGGSWLELNDDGTGMAAPLSANTTYELTIIGRSIGTSDASWDLCLTPTGNPGSALCATDLKVFASPEEAMSSTGIRFVHFFQEGQTPQNSFTVDDVTLIDSAIVPPPDNAHLAFLGGSDAAFLSWGANQGIDPAIGSATLATLDPEPDGLGAMLEYVFGLSLLEADAWQARLTPMVDPAGVTVSMVLRDNDPALSLDLLHATTLDPVSWVALPPESEHTGVDQTGVPSGFRRRSFTLPPAPRGFARLSADL